MVVMVKKTDPYYNSAKNKGYRSRASYKLLQIDEKFKIFSRGKKVVDLGASPGGWTQIAAEKVSSNGSVIAIDIAYIPPFKYNNIEIMQADIMNTTLEEIIIKKYGKVDVVLSDCAPNVSGNWTVDQATQLMLADRALEIAMKILKEKGWFVVKIFQGSDFPTFYAKVKEHFSFSKLFKPKASRKKSAEIYLIAQ